MLIPETTIKAETTKEIVDIINLFVFITLPQKFQYKNDDTPANDIIHHTIIKATVIDLNNDGLKILIRSFVFFKKTDENNAKIIKNTGANLLI